MEVNADREAADGDNGGNVRCLKPPGDTTWGGGGTSSSTRKSTSSEGGSALLLSMALPLIFAEALIYMYIRQHQVRMVVLMDGEMNE